VCRESRTGSDSNWVGFTISAHPALLYVFSFGSITQTMLTSHCGCARGSRQSIKVVISERQPWACPILQMRPRSRHARRAGATPASWRYYVGARQSTGRQWTFDRSREKREQDRRGAKVRSFAILVNSREESHSLYLYLGSPLVGCRSFRHQSVCHFWRTRDRKGSFISEFVCSNCFKPH